VIFSGFGVYGGYI